nr:DUF6491 family protein [Sphingomonas sp. Mn802worker]
MRTHLALLALPVLMLTAATADPTAGRVAGKPVDCISEIDTRAQAEIIDARTIAYSRTAKRMWITHPEGTCNGLAPARTLIVERRGARLCRGDRFRTIRAPATVPSPQCFFGRFTPYDKVAAR